MSELNEQDEQKILHYPVPKNGLTERLEEAERLGRERVLKSCWCEQACETGWIFELISWFKFNDIEPNINQVQLMINAHHHFRVSPMKFYQMGIIGLEESMFMGEAVDGRIASEAKSTMEKRKAALR